MRVDSRPITLSAAVTIGEVGPYRLVRPLGKGGMAEVFLAVHRHLGHVRALKVLWPEETSEARAALAKRLLTEARATSRLHHPAIVEVFDCDTLPGGGAFIAMEYLQGEPAGSWLERTGGLSSHPLLAAALVGVVADALGHAHAEGIVHRDVKPDNIVLVPDPDDHRRFTVKVLDFGIAKMLNEQPLVITRADRTIGTPCYMAPEQWFRSGVTDARSDVYALGCVLFEVLTGRPPFEREDGAAMMHAHLNEAPPQVRSLAPAAPPALESLVGRMLAKSPDDRPQTMIEVVTELERYLERYRGSFDDLLRAPEGQPVASGPSQREAATDLGIGPGAAASATAPVTEERRRRAAVLKLAAAAALALAGAAAFVAGSPSRRSPPPWRPRRRWRPPRWSSPRAASSTCPTRPRPGDRRCAPSRARATSTVRSVTEMQRLAPIAVVVALFAIGSAALAQPRGKRPEDEAKEQYDRGVVAYNLEHFDEAIAAFSRAYELDPAPMLLFNIAQARWKKGENERALFYYRRYLEAEPNAENRDRVEARIRELEAGARSAPSAPGPAPAITTTTEIAPVPAPPAYLQAGPVAERPRPVYRRAWFWGAVGAAAVATVAVVLLASSKGQAAHCAPADCNLGTVSVPRP